MDSIPAVFPCPKCRGGGHSYEDEIAWKHAGCGGQLYLCQNGDGRCSKCGRTTFIQNWWFNCGKYSHGIEYTPFNDVTSLFDAVGNATKAAAKHFGGQITALQKFTKNIVDNINKKWVYT